MRIGRNDPCPCGSGRKYKRCCRAIDEDLGFAYSGQIGPVVREVAGRAEEWQADLVPVAVGFDDEPAARPCGLVVMAEGLVIDGTLVARPGSEPEDVAADLGARLVEAAERFGAWPDRLRVGYEELVEPLSGWLERAGRPVQVMVGDVEELRAVALALRAHLGGDEIEEVDDAAPCFPDTWAAWQQPAEWCAEMFRAAAAYQRARPWRYVSGAEELAVTGPSGRPWIASVLGEGGQAFGFVLFRDREDFESMLDDGPGGGPAAVHGPILSLMFVDGASIPRAMRREVARAGWEVAEATAYPALGTFNTIAGGVTRRDGEDLLAALRAVTALAEAHGEDLPDLAEQGLCDEATGVEVRIVSRREELELALSELLAPGGPEGPGARPEAAIGRAGSDDDELLEQELAHVDAFEAALREEGLSQRTVDRHAGNAETFVDFLVSVHGVPLAALHEYDLRTFLYDWYPRKVVASRTEALAVPTSLRRFLRHLADDQGIHCPWAADLLRERERFEHRWDTFPGGSWWDEDVQEWRGVAHFELSLLAMTHDGGLGEDDEWGLEMGVTEARLEAELQRRWLLWRDELLREGLDSRRLLVERLVERQRAWEGRPHADLDGATPVEAIAGERRDRAERLNDPENEWF